jgi:uncharacterized protein
MVAAQRVPATSGKVPARAYPKARRIKFWFGDPEPMKHHFVEGDIVLGHLTALLSSGFPPGEDVASQMWYRMRYRIGQAPHG